MPRIRKGVIARSAIEIFWRIGLYIRLSREDENENESESVINQEKILRDFVNKYFGPGTYEIIGIFADDGLTGTDTIDRNSNDSRIDCPQGSELHDSQVSCASLSQPG